MRQSLLNPLDSFLPCPFCRLGLVVYLALNHHQQPAKRHQQVRQSAPLKPLFGQRHQPLLSQQARQLCVQHLLPRNHRAISIPHRKRHQSRLSAI